jgi:hypothetical protein
MRRGSELDDITARELRRDHRIVGGERDGWLALSDAEPTGDGHVRAYIERGPGGSRGPEVFRPMEKLHVERSERS